MDEELEKLRKGIDDIDRRMVDLLEERLILAKKVGKIKKKKGFSLEDTKREKKVMENAIKRMKDLDKGFIESLFKSIIDYCKNEESK